MIVGTAAEHLRSLIQSREQMIVDDRIRVAGNGGRAGNQTFPRPGVTARNPYASLVAWPQRRTVRGTARR